MNKTKMISVIVLLSLIVIVVLICNGINKNTLNTEEKNNLLEHIKVENENVLRSGNTVTISGNIKNYNKQSVKIKSINIILKDEGGNEITDIDLKINKSLKAKGIVKYFKDVKIKNYSQRVFTDYNIKI